MADAELPPITPELEANFWDRVDVRGEDECWEWQLARVNGYGVWAKKKAKSRERWRFFSTHMALTLDGRARPLGMNALHSCDNPPCCNPKHLRWGTILENNIDTSKRGRKKYNKLTEYFVKRIIEDSRTGHKIAADYGISQELVSRIKRRKVWAWIEV